MTRSWMVGDVVKLFDGAYGVATIVRIDKEGEECDVARPYLRAMESGGWAVSVEEVKGILTKRLVPAEMDREGNPHNMLHGLYTFADLHKVANGDWKL